MAIASRQTKLTARMDESKADEFWLEGNETEHDFERLPVARTAPPQTNNKTSTEATD